jgi:hypothetical protein
MDRVISRNTVGARIARLATTSRILIHSAWRDLFAPQTRAVPAWLTLAVVRLAPPIEELTSRALGIRQASSRFVPTTPPAVESARARQTATNNTLISLGFRAQAVRREVCLAWLTVTDCQARRAAFQHSIFRRGPAALEIGWIQILVFGALLDTLSAFQI